MDELAQVDRPLLVERHHPWRPWVLAGLLLIVGAAVFGAFYYAPLTVGPLDCPPPAELIAAPESEFGPLDPPRCLLTAGTTPLEVELSATLRNDGPLTVAVAGVALPPGLDDLVVVTAATVDGGTIGPSEVPIGPGEQGQLRLALRLAPCEVGRAERLITFDELPLRTRFAAITTTQGVGLATELSLLRAAC
jgi:hypothetical protein